MRYVNGGGRTSSVREWLLHIPDEVVDRRLRLVQAWIAALRGDEAGMRDALARFHALGGEDSGPLPDGFASLASSVSVLRTAFAWGDVGRTLEEGARAAELEGPESPWRPVVTWALGWGYYCSGELDLAARWLTETAELAPAAEQWVVGCAALADLSLIAGIRDDRGEQIGLALAARDLAREHGLLEAREVGEVHTAHERRWRPRAGTTRRWASSSAASSCAACGRSRSTSPTA